MANMQRFLQTIDAYNAFRLLMRIGAGDEIFYSVIVGLFIDVKYVRKCHAKNLSAASCPAAGCEVDLR